MEKEYSPRLAGVNPKLGDNHEFPHSPREPGTRFKETVTAFYRAILRACHCLQATCVRPVAWWCNTPLGGTSCERHASERNTAISQTSQVTAWRLSNTIASWCLWPWKRASRCLGWYRPIAQSGLTRKLFFWRGG